MASFCARRVCAVWLCVLFLPLGTSEAAPLRVSPSPVDTPCRLAVGDSWQDHVTYAGGKGATDTRACALDPVPLEALLRLDASLQGCGQRVWEAELPQCRWDANSIYESPHREGSPRALGVLVAALATPAETEVDRLTEPSQSLVLVEWMLVGAIVAFGLLRLTLGRD